MTAPITIVGTGLAGYNLARELRKLAPDAALRIVSADAGDFYSKPMLSNALAGNKSPEQLAMKPAAKMAEELRAELLTHTRLEAIDPAARRIATRAGAFDYDRLVLALGADQASHGLAGDAAGEVLSVNDLADYARFRGALAGKRRVVLLGGGLIGCEFANDLAATGHAVEVIDPAGWPLSRLLPEAAGRRLEAKLAELGVAFHWGVSAQSVERDGAGYRVTLSDGRVLAAELVLSAIGLKPRIGLAQAAGLAVGRGIVVDRRLQTSAPGIYALGDCAEVDGWLLPYVMPIMQAARALAATLAGNETAVSYPAMPVLVKTPACPLVVSPPAPGAAGTWQVEQDDAALRASFVAADGKLLGFALLGAATAERQAFVGRVPPVLA
ncbi:NAD(P)/FAD-dependent oxidoreductase [Chitinimonas koreensis]|uniref:NAD(P)/FAD-dependent oxidoreductase n=1 Tax=Chitinimonas koreensis TaxID=356302 RepID=UPI0003FAEC1D|nr:FAD-dependent oxidoreductase [Chitinimonas koreensis]QNM94872.1 FAD-dependent oxidoreductase [Chitinimonas koreensis]